MTEEEFRALTDLRRTAELVNALDRIQAANANILAAARKAANEEMLVGFSVMHDIASNFLGWSMAHLVESDDDDWDRGIAIMTAVFSAIYSAYTHINVNGIIDEKLIDDFGIGAAGIVEANFMSMAAAPSSYIVKLINLLGD